LGWFNEAPPEQVKIFRAIGAVWFVSVRIVLAGNGDLPRTLAELDRWYLEPPAGQNAATKFLEGIAALKITDSDSNSASLPLAGKGERPHPDKAVPPEMKAAITEFVERNQPAFHAFGQAAQLQESRYPIQLNRGQWVLLPHLTKIRHTAQILELSAISHAVAGQGKDAGDDLLAGLALARSLESEPVLISQLVRVACNSIMVKSLEQTLNRITLPQQTLDQLQKSLQRSEEREAAGFGFTRGFVGKQVSDLSAFDMPPEGYLTISDKATPEERKKLELEIKETLAADRKFCQTTFDQALAVRKQPFPARLTQDVFAEAYLVATNRNLPLSSVLFGGLNKDTALEASSLANLRLAQTTIALERFRSAHANHFPDSLTELAPNYLSPVPADPFDGKPLRYHKKGIGYALYSIGQNLMDDGGKSGNGTEGDIVFAVISPPQNNP